MMLKVAERVADAATLLRLSLRLQLGRRFWLVPALALLWPLYHALTVLVGWREIPFDAAQVQLEKFDRRYPAFSQSSEHVGCRRKEVDSCARHMRLNSK